MSPTNVGKRRSARGSSFLGFKCGCRGSKSVSISASGSGSSSKSMPAPVQRPVRERWSAETLTPASTSSHWDEDDGGAKRAGLATVPSFSGLLRQLNDLEQSIVAWGLRQRGYAPHCISCEETETEKTRMTRSNSNGGGWRAEEGVPMVKESEDPLGDFRRSMLQMIVEKEIVDGEELRGLLRRFLLLNSPTHHELIIRAFTEIWEEVFSGYDDTPDLLLRHRRRRNHPRIPRPGPF